MYGKYSPVMGTEHCIHQFDIDACVRRAEDVQHIDPGRAAAMILLGRELVGQCKTMRDPSDPASCPLTDKLGRLEAFAKDESNAAALRNEAVERGKIRRPIRLDPEQEILAQVVDIATVDSTFAYSASSGRRPEVIQRSPGACVGETFILQQKLRAVGVDSQVMWYVEPPLFTHFFLRIETQTGEPLVVDPTWQQFLPKEADHESLPHTLVVPASKTTEVAAALGVPKDSTGTWSKSQPSNKKWWEFNSTSINNVMLTDGWNDEPLPMQPALAQRLAAARTESLRLQPEPHSAPNDETGGGRRPESLADLPPYTDPGTAALYEIQKTLHPPKQL